MQNIIKVDDEKYTDDVNTVYVEHCANCKIHNWNTTHNEKKY
jgi:hypothetical protein